MAVSITRAELKTNIYLLVNKTSTNPGIYTDAKVNAAINEAMDFVAEEMFDAGEGWQAAILTANTTDGMTTLSLTTLDADIAMIREVRMLVGDIYLPMKHDEAYGAAQVKTDTSPARQTAGTYRLVDNSIIFNPPLSDALTNGLQIEVVKWPTYPLLDATSLPASFQRATWHYMKYKAASIMAGSLEKPTRPWQQEELEWFNKMKRVLVKRNQQSTPIGNFDP